MADVTKKYYLDLAGLTKYDQEIKAFIGASLGALKVEDVSVEGQFVNAVVQANGVIAPERIAFVETINNNSSKSKVAPQTAAVYNYVNSLVSGAALAPVKAVKIANGSIAIAIKDGENVLSQTDNGLESTLKLAWDGDGKKLQIKGIGDAVVSELDASHFVVDGMLDSVAFSSVEGDEDKLVFKWNTAAGKIDTTIDLGKYMNAQALADINASITDLSTNVSTLKDADAAILETIGVKHIAAAEGVAEVKATGLYKYVDEAVAALDGDTSTKLAAVDVSLKAHDSSLDALAAEVAAFERILDASILALFGK